MPKKQIVYSCKFCNRYALKSKESVINHESYCFKNPKNKACKTCAYFKNSLRNQSEKEFAGGNISRCSKLNLLFYYDHDRQKTVEDSTGKVIYVNDLDSMIKGTKPPFPKKECDLHKKKILCKKK